MTSKRTSNSNSKGKGKIRGSLHYGGKCAAFGRDDDFWLGGEREEARAITRATADPCGMTNKRTIKQQQQQQQLQLQRQRQNTGVSPLRRQSAPSSVEMTIFGVRVGRRGQATAITKATADPCGMTNKKLRQ
jgi:hypothetical protein